MPTKHMFAKNLTSNELIPALQEWLSERHYEVSIVANRVDGQLGKIKLRILIEDYGRGCSISITGSDQESIEKVASCLSEIFMFGYRSEKCEYCGRLFSAEQASCPHCGGPRKLDRKSKS